MEESIQLASTNSEGSTQARQKQLTRKLLSLIQRIRFEKEVELEIDREIQRELEDLTIEDVRVEALIE